MDPLRRILIRKHGSFRSKTVPMPTRVAEEWEGKEHISQIQL